MQELERWLEEATNASWTSGPEEGKLLRPVAEYYIHQLAAVPRQAMPVLLHAIETAGKLCIATAFEVVRVIGYPQNAAAIPYLFYFLSNPNFPGDGMSLGPYARSMPRFCCPISPVFFSNKNPHSTIIKTKRTGKRW